jgi:peptidoglycan/xylan/chitin deacetylase (PgdA/CDA1 family)
MPPHGIMFHHFAGEGHPPVQGALGAEELEALLDARRSLLPAREWAARAEAGTLAEDDLCLTFDDSLRSAYDVARPVLERRGLTAFWFVYTSVVDGALDPFELDRQFRNRHFPSVDAFHEAFLDVVARGAHGEEVRARLRSFDPGTYLAEYTFYGEGDRRFRFVRDEVLGPARYRASMDALMAARGVERARLAENLWLDAVCLRRLHAAGHVVGLHSHTHPLRMAALPVAEQEKEYATNHERLRAILGEAPLSMSHPSNSYSADTLRVLEGLGIRLGFRTDLVPAASRLEHPRQDQAHLRASPGRRP